MPVIQSLLSLLGSTYSECISWKRQYWKGPSETDSITILPQMKSSRQQGKMNLSTLGMLSSLHSLKFVIYMDFCAYLPSVHCLPP